MPFTHGKSTAVILGGTDVSSFLNSVDQTITRDVSESSTFGAQAKSYLKGHKDGTISLSGYWDGASGAIDSVMASALGNEVLGYGSTLINTGELLANYSTSSQVTEDTSTPIAGFNASISFADNNVLRFASKAASVTINQKLLFSCYVRMNDSSAPLIGTTTSGFDMAIEIQAAIIPSANVSIQLVSGNIYQVLTVFTTTSTGVLNAGIIKTTGQSLKGFRIAGLSLRAVATVQQTRQVDTYGPELLTAGELLANYPVQGNVSQASTPISGLSGSIQFGDNSATRFAYKVYASYALGAQYFFRALMQMSDDSVPTVGTQSSIFDASLVVHGDVTYGFNTGPAPQISRLLGAIYEVAYRFTCVNLNAGNTGLVKYSGLNSARQFRAGGYSLRQITPVTVPTAPPLSICEAGTSTAGLRALVVQAHDTSYQVTGTTGDTVAVSVEFQVDGSFGSGAFRGVVLAPLASYSTGTNTTAVDNGSTTSGGFVANFHVLSNVEWVTMKIQHSTDNSTWVDLLTSTSFSQNSSEHLVTPNVVYRYLRVNITASGSTTPRLIVTAARK